MRGLSSSAAKPPKKKRRSNSKAGAVVSLLGAFVATSVALGLLAAAVFLPLTGMVGTGVKSGVHTFQNIPGQLASNALSQQSVILAADGSTIATPYSENRIVVPSSAIPKIMKDAQVAIEDERFYEHGALDRRGLARALAANLFSSGTQGASTLTQQYVKVAEQTQAYESGDTEAAAKAVSQSGVDGYVRKLKQLKFAVDLEKTHTKDQILTSYLNIVYFGDQQYGIEAASRHYFGHPAKDLTLPEAATLAGVVNLPTSTNPITNPKAAKARRDIVLQKMAKQKFITQAQADAAIATPIKTHVTTFASGCASSKYPYYCDYVTQYLSTLPALGNSPKERLGKLKTGGLRIQTALDPKMTATLEKQLKKSVPTDNAAGVQSAGVIVQPGTGYIQAMAQDTKYDLAGTDGFNTSVNYTTQGFPIGSTAKLFAIVEAARQGKTAKSTVNVPRMTGTDSAGPYAVFNSKNLPGPCGQRRGTWNVHNDEPEPAGPMSLKTATAKSVNTAFAQLTGDLGACAVRDDFARLGVYSTYGGVKKEISKDPSDIVLGAGSSSPLMMANAYATIAADGKYCTPRPVVSIKTADGKNLDMKVPACKQVITPEQSRNVAEAFRGPLSSEGTASDAKLADGRDAIGKTGTVSDSKHTWFVGSTTQYSTAVWVGRAMGNTAPIKNVTIGGKRIGGFLYGGDIAAPTWKAVMDGILKGQPKKSIPKPSGSDAKK